MSVKALREVTVLRKVADLRNDQGDVIGYQQGLGYVALPGQVLEDQDVSPLVLEALNDEDHELHESMSLKFEIVTGDEGDSPAVPFEGYDDLDEEEVIAAITNLPTAAKLAVRRYEEANENRQAIVEYNIGFGESNLMRQEGKVGSDVQEPDEDKESGKITTRNVPEEGPVEPGEGITGTGDPKVKPGTKKLSGSKSGAKRPVRRRRRARTTEKEKEGEE